MQQFFRIMWHYCQTRRLAFPSRLALLDHQKVAIARHLRSICRKSAYYSEYQGLNLSAFPVVDKAFCLDHFDEMNTAGLRLQDVQQVAMEAERTRNFSPTIRNYTVGLSSGTSGTRGIFVASPAERAKWAGIVLARLLPQGILSGERIAFFLRANSNLYTSVRTPFVSFKFFDLTDKFEPQLETLRQYQPTVIVAPAQVLRAIALSQKSTPIRPKPKMVISVAEVLDKADRILIEKNLVRPSEVYQATEGFLAYTCAHGTLHLNEEFLHIEPEWIDAEQTRMVPIITDFSRTTQPVIRYRLNDVLAVKPASFWCPCGNHSIAIDHIEGRCDDMLELPAQRGATLQVFSDTVSRLILQVLPLTLDYRLHQTNANTLELICRMSVDEAHDAIYFFKKRLAELGVDIHALRILHISQTPVFNPSAKRRRIIREKF